MPASSHIAMHGEDVCCKSGPHKVYKPNNGLPGIAALLCGLIVLSISVPAFTQTPVKIGFLIRDKNDQALQHAAQMAIDQANANGGFKGRPFQLVTRSCDGPWGVGSKEAVALIYQDQVPIVVTALDGRNAHLAEQVAAKAQVLMLSTHSSDPSLSRAYVPWYFSMVPDDKQQSRALIHKIYGQSKANQVAVISAHEYDGNKSAETFADMVLQMNMPKAKAFEWVNDDKMLDVMLETSWDALVLAGSAESLGEVLPKLEIAEMHAFLNITNFTSASDPAYHKKVWMVSAKMFDKQAWKSFLTLYSENHLHAPSPSLAFVYDGIIMATLAISRFGTDADAIRNGFREIEFNGITGEVRFNKLGSRELPVNK
jgi:branched-chain amino acid transport system substrate-binding protein